MAMTVCLVCVTAIPSLARRRHAMMACSTATRRVWTVVVAPAVGSVRQAPLAKRATRARQVCAEPTRGHAATQQGVQTANVTRMRRLRTVVEAVLTRQATLHVALLPLTARQSAASLTVKLLCFHNTAGARGPTCAAATFLRRHSGPRLPGIHGYAKKRWSRWYFTAGLTPIEEGRATMGTTVKLDTASPTRRPFASLIGICGLMLQLFTSCIHTTCQHQVRSYRTLNTAALQLVPTAGCMLEFETGSTFEFCNCSHVLSCWRDSIPQHYAKTSKGRVAFTHMTESTTGVHVGRRCSW